MKLIIVESPGKIKKIESILKNDFQVKASVGHIRDLDKKGLSYDETTFKADYKILTDKVDVVKNLKNAAKNCSTIYLASDPDREGEAISAGLREVLNLSDYKRITFNSITSAAIKSAIDSPRLIDDKLVEAQETRRILDRMLGYKISPLLMKKFGQYRSGGLSAGRVQSVVVRILVDLESDINKFVPESCFQGHAETTINDKKINLSVYYKNKLFQGDEKDSRKILDKLKTSKFILKELNEKIRESNPPAPFITSTLQQEASNKLKYDLQKTMKVAQALYEAGKITYMRTDSPSFSKEAINPIKDIILKQYGDLFKYREYKSKSASAQEAHECIRPTHPDHLPEEEDNALYSLIWKRTIASLMESAKYQVFTVIVGTDDPNITLKGEVERLSSPGYLKVYGQDAEEEIVLDGKVKELKLKDIYFQEKISSPPSRYGEASLVKDLEKLEIGRPSTYAALITKIKDRGYIEEKDHDGKTYDQKTLKLVKSGKDYKIEEDTEKIVLGKEKKRLTPTILGYNITKLLVEMFPNIMETTFTAKTEALLDEIANGTKKKLNVLTEFWNILKNYLDNLSSLVLPKPDNNELGEYKGGKIFIVTTRYGDAIKYEKGKEKSYVSIKDKSISLEDAIKALEDKETNVSGELLGEDTHDYKYYKAEAKYGPVVKRVKGSDIDYRSIKDCPKEVDIDLAIILFRYPIEIDKNVNLNYNIAKDSYYFKVDEGTGKEKTVKFIGCPKETAEGTKSEIKEYYEENKDSGKAKAVGSKSGFKKFTKKK